MKEGFDKEIDSLLRGLPGATAGPRARGNGASAAKADAHLDADELSAFVEGALPAAARLNVSAHLADCDECRGLAVSLTRAAGVEGEIERRAAVPALAESSKPSRRRSWLAALFAPGALRYVAPALALCLIAAVSFVALRSRRAEERLAQVSNSAAPRADITDNQSSAETNDALQSPSGATSNANVTVTSTATNNATNRGAATTNAASDQTAKESPAGSASSSAAAADKLDRVAEPPAPAMKDAPAAAPVVESPARNETVEVTNTSERPKEAQTETGAGQSQPQQRTNLSSIELRQQSPDGSRNRSSVNGAQNNPAGAGGLIAGNRREDRDSSDATASAPAARRKPSDEKRAKKSEESKVAEGDDEDARKGETRSAAGHSFRREGGAWVDVNYKSSMSSTGVHRGTDSFRALVADIPELGRVAEQLGGEVVVVIHGRAYRIR